MSNGYIKYKKYNFNSLYKEKGYDKAYFKLLNEYFSRLSYEFKISEKKLNVYLDRFLDNFDEIIYTDDLQNERYGYCNTEQRRIELNENLLNLDNNGSEGLFLVFAHVMTHAIMFDQKDKVCGMYKNAENENLNKYACLDEYIVEYISRKIVPPEEDEYTVTLAIIEILSSILGVSNSTLIKLAIDGREKFDEKLSNKFIDKMIYENFMENFSATISKIFNTEFSDYITDEKINENMEMALKELMDIANLFLVERSKKDLIANPYQDLGEYINRFNDDLNMVKYIITKNVEILELDPQNIVVNKYLKDNLRDRMKYIITLYSYEQTKNVYDMNIKNYVCDEKSGEELLQELADRFGMHYNDKEINFDASYNDFVESFEEELEEKEEYRNKNLSEYIQRNIFDQDISDIAKEKITQTLSASIESIKNMYNTLKERFGFASDETKLLPESSDLEDESNKLDSSFIEKLNDLEENNEEKEKIKLKVNVSDFDDNNVDNEEIDTDNYEYEDEDENEKKDSIINKITSKFSKIFSKKDEEIDKDDNDKTEDYQYEDDAKNDNYAEDEKEEQFVNSNSLKDKNVMEDYLKMIKDIEKNNESNLENEDEEDKEDKEDENFEDSNLDEVKEEIKKDCDNESNFADETKTDGFYDNNDENTNNEDEYSELENINLDLDKLLANNNTEVDDKNTNVNTSTKRRRRGAAN